MVFFVLRQCFYKRNEYLNLQEKKIQRKHEINLKLEQTTGQGKKKTKKIYSVNCLDFMRPIKLPKTVKK